MPKSAKFYLLSFCSLCFFYSQPFFLSYPLPSFIFSVCRRCCPGDTASVPPLLLLLHHRRTLELRRNCCSSALWLLRTGDAPASPPRTHLCCYDPAAAPSISTQLQPHRRVESVSPLLRFGLGVAQPHASPLIPTAPCRPSCAGSHPTLNLLR